MSNEIVKQMLLLRTEGLVLVGLTAVAYLVLSILVGRLRVEGTGYRLAGLFVGMDIRSVLHLSVVWIKLVLYVQILLLTRSAQAVHYVSMALLILFACLLGGTIKKAATEMLAGASLMAGMWVCANLMEYLRRIHHDQSIVIAYWLLAVFLSLCAVVVFLKEIAYVSEERKHFNENGDIE